MTRGGRSALIVPISGTVTWKSDRISSRYASNSSSARSISSMSRTGATPSVDLERLEQRPADEEIGPEDVVGRRPFGLAARLEQPDLEHLARVVPLVDRGVDVEALVALEPDERRPEAGRKDLGQLRLADAGLAFEQQRAPELERQEDRRRERAVRDVVALAEVVGQRLDGAGAGGPGVAVGHRTGIYTPSGELTRRARPVPGRTAGSGTAGCG